MIAEAVIAIVPGGREGTARAGALPSATSVMSAPPAKLTAPPVPIVIRPEGHGYPRPGGTATNQAEPGVPSKAIGAQASLITLELEAGAAVPPHVHAGETEILYLLGGGGTMTVGGVSLPVSEDSVIQIPPGVEHSFTASEATVALQLYTPAGPEQRFKKPPPR
jgi:quercetin dioxygenase-like cupin family protein